MDWNLLVGQKLGRLLVLEIVKRPIGVKRDGRKGWMVHYALCECECGVRKEVSVYNLNKTLSCGCLQKEKAAKINLTHGMSNSKEYGSWQSMRKRCNYPNDTRYPEYGARGIRVCPEWDDSFEAFLEDMGKMPTDGGRYSIERRDADGDYEPRNCYWLPLNEQPWNKTNTRKTTDGICYGEVLRKNGIPPTRATPFYKYVLSSGQIVDFYKNAPFSTPSLVRWFKDNRGQEVQLR